MKRKKNRKICVFEHDTLKIGNDENDLDENEFESLLRFHEKADKSYFSLERRKIKFKHYVGALQVGRLTIEVLPKAGKGDKDINKWHNTLVKILKYTQKIRSSPADTATLNYSKQNLLELYFEQFMHEVDVLLKEGLRKKYRYKEDNLTKLKGRIIFNKNIQKNQIHKEKMFCRFQTYNFNHDIHSAIKYALIITENTVRNNTLISNAKRLLLYFPKEVENYIRPVRLDFIVLDRTTKRYEQALQLAKLIIKSYCPLFKAGQVPVSAFMFDMNHLFEEFVFKMFKSIVRESNYEVFRSKKVFWEDRKIKPDIIIKAAKKNIIIDTKWIMPKENIPSDDNLKQIYVYSHYFNSPDSYLLYPCYRSEEKISQEELEGFYKRPPMLESRNIDFRCRLRFLPFFYDSDKIDLDAMKNYLSSILEESDLSKR